MVAMRRGHKNSTSQYKLEKIKQYFPKSGLNDKTWLLGQLSELCSAGTISSAFNSTRHSNYTGCVLAVTGALSVTMQHT